MDREDNLSSNPHRPLESPATYSDNVHSQDYISQFLSIVTFPSERNPVQQPNRVFTSAAQNMLLNESELFDNPVSEESGKKRIKSAYHNFQKHLVTTLRQFVKIPTHSPEDSDSQLEGKLWDIFMKCPRMTRTLLYLIYGGLDIQVPKNRKLAKQYGLLPIMKQYSAGAVRKAQRRIREETLLIVKEINLDWALGNRRMKKKDDFRIYFEAFVEELSDGGFNKRVPKDKKQLVQKRDKLSRQQEDIHGLSC